MSGDYPGKLIANRYRLGEQLGEGGMGTVYHGLDATSGQNVAIKQLKPEAAFDDPGVVERFLREAEALRQLNHPNIVKVFDTIAENGEHYIVMEYVSGGSLADLLASSGKLPLAQVLTIAIELSDALTRAHYLDIIHRDIKPGNVLIAEDGTPRLTDFGVAFLGSMERVTETGVAIGTLHYISPELLNGERVDSRSDIWSFGVMLFEMLAGERPFEGDTASALLSAILTKPAPDLNNLSAEIPPDLGALVDTMLQKERDQRIDSVRKVGAALENVMRGGEVSVSRFDTPSSIHEGRTTRIDSYPGVPARLPKWIWIIVASILVLVGVAVVLVVAGVFDADDSARPTTTITGTESREHMVLVAQIENIGGNERDVTRFIVDDLRRRLEVEAPFSNMPVRQLDRIIASDQEAIQLAETHAASVIIWGNYNDERVQLEVQAGSLTKLAHNQFEHEVIARTGNVRVELADEQAQSIAPQTAGVLAVMQVADGDMFEVGRAIAVIKVLADVETGTIISGGVAPDVHAYFASSVVDDEQAIGDISQAIAADAGNPLLYIFRYLPLFRQDLRLAAASSTDLDFTEAQRQDIATALRLGPENWTPTIHTSTGTGGDFRSISSRPLEQMLASRSDDWYAHYLMALIISFNPQPDLDLANDLINTAISLQPESNLPYAPGALLAFREGRVVNGVEIMNTALRRFPDQTLSSRIYAILVGTTTSDELTASIFGQLLIGQHDAAAQELEDFFASSGILARRGLTAQALRFFSGIAFCNQGEHAFATLNYRRVVNEDAEFLLASVLEIESRLALDQGISSLLLRIERSDQAEILAPYVHAVQEGTLGCHNIFDLEALQTAEEAYTEILATDSP